MKRIILCLSLFAFFGSQAQQINPVPDYVFSNKMSVGRNAVTDTAAYFSIGPRYGAIRGMMPPMVTDTASMSATKRNGLLIFSIQKNKYLYWDSVGVKWAEMAGTAGSAITGSGVAGYMPEFTTATNLDTTRLYHSAGRFAIGSTTTTNGVFNVYSGQSYMDSTLKIGNGELIVGSTSSASRKLYVTSNSDVARFEQTASDKNMVIELRHTNPNASGTIREESINFLAPNTSTRGRITFYPSDTFNVRNYLAFFTPSGSGTNAERMRIANDGEVLIGTTSDAGAFTLQINGGIYTTREGIYLDGFKDWQVETNNGSLLFYNRSTNVRRLVIDSAGTLSVGAIDNDFGTSAIFRVNPNTNETYIGSLVDYGNYTLQVDGNFYGRGTGTFTKEISATSATTNAGNPSTATFYSGDDGAAIWRAALSLQHNSDVTISAGSGIGIVFSPLASTGSVFYGSAGIKAIRPNNTANNQNTDLTFITRAGASNTTTDTEKMRITSAGELLINTTTDAGAYALQVAGSIYNTTTITTGAPTGGSIKPWRLGEAATVSPTSPNRTIRVEIDGTVYYIHAKTTND